MFKPWNNDLKMEDSVKDEPTDKLKSKDKNGIPKANKGLYLYLRN